MRPTYQLTIDQHYRPNSGHALWIDKVENFGLTFFGSIASSATDTSGFSYEVTYASAYPDIFGRYC